MPERLAPPRPEFHITSSILSSLQDGNQATWSAFFNHYSPLWERYAGRRGLSREVAEETVSSTVSKIYRKLCSAPDQFEGDLEAYAWTAFRNSYRSARRREQNTSVTVVPIDPLVNEDGIPRDHSNIWIDDSPGPEEVVMQAESARTSQTLFNQALSPLGERDRHALELLRTDSSPTQITHELGLRNERHANVVVFRAKERARRALTKAGYATAS